MYLERKETCHVNFANVLLSRFKRRPYFPAVIWT